MPRVCVSIPEQRMSRGATFDRVYAALKQRLVSGAFVPGAALEPGSLTDDLAASVTPIRDALHRLAGERLVDTHRHDGFQVPIVIEAALRDLYAWNGAVLQLAARASAGERLPLNRMPEAETPAGLASALFLHIARWSSNREQAAAVSRLNDRLYAARMAEAEVLPSILEELAALREAVARLEPRPVQHLLSTYHRRRLRFAGRIADRLMTTYSDAGGAV